MSGDLHEAKRTLLMLLGGRWPGAGIASQQWPLLAELARDHRLEPLLAWRGERAAWPLPASVATAWNVARRQSALAVLAQQAALRLALSELAKAGIAAVALKGVPLAWRSYPEPALRPMRDVDLLVTETRAAQASAVLERAGFVADAAGPGIVANALRHDHQLPAQTHRALGVTIELHHRLSDPPERRGYRVPQLDPAAMLARAGAADCGGVSVPSPAPQDLAAHLIVHAVYGHRLDCGPLVLADLHFLAAGGDIVWEALRATARRGGWLRGTDLLLALTERHFGTSGVAFEAPPPAILAAAEDALLPDPAARGHAEALADIAAARSPGARAGMLARRLTPSAEVVAREGGGRSALAFWPRWATRRVVRLAHRLGDRRARAEAGQAAAVLRWVQS